tara:strand:+ start:24856 stop:25482 length:627 start_codon:yes stop_codon:yes gene_type:complete
MSWLSSFLHPDRGYKAGQEQLDKYYNQAQQQYQPFINQGQNAYGGLNEAMQNLLDPQALQDKWASGYKESDAAKQMEGMAQEHGLNAASSMGLMGSSPALQAIQAGTSQIGAQDRQSYLDNLMQKYLAGTGIAQSVYGTGANAAGQAGQNAMNMGQNSAQMAFGQQNAPGDMFSKLLQGAASFATPIGQAWGMNKLGLNNSPWSTGGA